MKNHKKIKMEIKLKVSSHCDWQ